ncbi:PRD domain-containing protein [Dolosigranulum pigrum]|uniref:PRD domain-containing protein n=1 Tax=Dolosigranulum pigrum TaxID=29394 RepID=A0A516GLF4_9LACT|nr:PRD domain-containing protein [Dolosigranulum pigrum]
MYLNKYKLFERIKDHLAYLINRLLFKIPHQNNINIKLENEYPLAYEFAKETAYIIEKN